MGCNFNYLPNIYPYTGGLSVQINPLSLQAKTQLEEKFTICLTVQIYYHRMKLICKHICSHLNINLLCLNTRSYTTIKQLQTVVIKFLLIILFYQNENNGKEQLTTPFYFFYCFSIEVRLEAKQKTLMYQGFQAIMYGDPDWVRTSDPHPVKMVLSLLSYRVILFCIFYFTIKK